MSETYEGAPALIADDTLLAIAKTAEARIDAVIKIKQLALKVTNASDWTDQQGKPYLQASGSEKVANLFNISWQIDEPSMETETDGAITYIYKGRFSLGGRSIEVEGSRSSRDEFFKKYIWENGAKKGEKPLDRRDLKMAAMTNLLGNGITRILGIRNLSWEDLEAFANIKKEQVAAIQYKTKGEKQPLQQPGKKSEATKAAEPAGEKITLMVEDVRKQTGTNKQTNKPWTKFIVKAGEKEYGTFSETFAQVAKDSMQSAVPVEITFTTTKFGNDIVAIKIVEPEKERQPGEEG